MVVLGLVELTIPARLLAQSPLPPALTLADAVKQALQNNGRVLESFDGAEQANLTRQIAQSVFKPKIVPNFLGAIGQSDISNQTYALDVSQRFTTGTEFRTSVGVVSAQNQLGTFYYSDTTLMVTQPLLRGFGRDAVRRDLTYAEEQVESAARQRTLTEQQVTIDVATAYYAVVAQQQMVAVAAKALERSRDLLDASSAKLAAGRVSQLDVLRAQQLAAEAETHLLDARSASDDAEDQLRLLMGRGPDDRFVVDPVIPVAVDSIAIDDAVTLALQHRSDLANARHALAWAEHTTETTNKELLPQLDVKLALTRRETAESLGSSLGLDKFRVVPFAAVSMPLDRSALTVALNKALIEQQRRRRELETLQMKVATDVRRAVRQQERLVNGVHAADASVDFAEKEVDVATLRFQRGLSNNLDLITAETNLLTVQSRRIAVLADLAVARLNVKATVGTLDPYVDVK
jgi:outer membrane protein TolC